MGGTAEGNTRKLKQQKSDPEDPLTTKDTWQGGDGAGGRDGGGAEQRTTTTASSASTTTTPSTSMGLQKPPSIAEDDARWK